MFETVRTTVRENVCEFEWLCVCMCVCTFGCGEHGRGQLTLLGLNVAEGEPTRVAVGYHGNNMMRPRQVTR